MVSKRFEEMLQAEVVNNAMGDMEDLFDLMSSLDSACTTAKLMVADRIKKDGQDDFKRAVVAGQLKTFIEMSQVTGLPYADYINIDKVKADLDTLNAKHNSE